MPTPFVGQRKSEASKGDDSSYFEGISAKGKQRAWKMAWEQSRKEAENENPRLSPAFTTDGTSLFDD